MEKCIFCGTNTSFHFQGEGEHENKPICPKCQAERFDTNFNTGCNQEGDCSIKISKKQLEEQQSRE